MTIVMLEAEILSLLQRVSDLERSVDAQADEIVLNDGLGTANSINPLESFTFVNGVDSYPVRFVDGMVFLDGVALAEDTGIANALTASTGYYRHAPAATAGYYLHVTKVAGVPTKWAFCTCALASIPAASASQIIVKVASVPIVSGVVDWPAAFQFRTGDLHVNQGGGGVYDNKSIDLVNDGGADNGKWEVYGFHDASTSADYITTDLLFFKDADVGTGAWITGSRVVALGLSDSNIWITLGAVIPAANISGTVDLDHSELGDIDAGSAGDDHDGNPNRSVETPGNFPYVSGSGAGTGGLNRTANNFETTVALRDEAGAQSIFPGGRQLFADGGITLVMDWNATTDPDNLPHLEGDWLAVADFYVGVDLFVSGDADITGDCSAASFTIDASNIWALTGVSIAPTTGNISMAPVAGNVEASPVAGDVVFTLDEPSGKSIYVAGSKGISISSWIRCGIVYGTAVEEELVQVIIDGQPVSRYILVRKPTP